MTQAEFEAGKKARVKLNLDATRESYDLDEDGNMLSMMGNIFEIDSVTEKSVRIYHSSGRKYTFCKCDITPISDKIMQSVTKPELFNTDNLV